MQNERVLEEFFKGERTGAPVECGAWETEEPSDTAEASDSDSGNGEQKSDREAKFRIDNFGAFNGIFNFHSEIQYLTIIGSVEGHTIEPPQDKTTRYENVIPQLVAVEENPNIKGLLIILNTMGGDVEAGLALAELITTLSKPTVSLVLGGGHSIGVPLATAADYSFIAESAAMTIHPIRLTGLVIGASPTYDYFHKMQDRVVDFIVRTSGAEKKSVLQLMNATDQMANDVGTILFGKEAVQAGIINEVGGLSSALRKLRDLIREREA